MLRPTNLHLLCFFLVFLPYGSHAQLFDDINQFLLSEVHGGKINYQKLADNPEPLNKVISQLEQEDLGGKSDDYKLAFYINGYNLLVIKQVLDNYPISSPMDVDGFFKKNKLLIAGELLTLDEIEFDKLINEYRDPRIHFTLGCAARSCPFLYDNAYTPEHIQEQLEFRSQLIIDRPNYVEVNDSEKTITLCKIFDWYKDQFSFSAGSVINFINKYRFYKVPETYLITYWEYDWRLNEIEQ